MNLKTIISLLNDTDVGEDVLHSLGLERRSSAVGGFVSGLGVFMAGALVGAGVGLLLAPTTGAEMRERARASIDEWRQRLMDFGQNLQAQAASVADQASAMASNVGRKEPMSNP